MKAITPELVSGETLVEYAKNQKEYATLPAAKDKGGAVTTEWELDSDERKRIGNGGRLRVRILTFNQPLQPIMINVIGGVTLEEAAKSKGFKDMGEFNHAMSSATIETPSKLDAFIKWRDSDGTKKDLLKLPYKCTKKRCKIHVV